MAKKPAKRIHPGKPPKGWPFDQSPNTVAFTLRRIVLPKKGVRPRPILFVTHEEDDHSWQFLDGDSMSMKDAALVSMEEMLTLDPSLAEIADLPPGWQATRPKRGAAWKRARYESNRVVA